MTSFEKMHNDHLDPDRWLWNLEEGEGDEGDGRMNDLLIALCEEFDADTVGALYRRVYKGSACGMSMGVELVGQGHLYCEDLYKVTVESLRSKEARATAIMLSSIVEGVDETTSTQVIDTPEATTDDFWTAADRVEAEADDIWMQTHGCEDCAAHWGVDFEYECGAIPVWSDCPGCGGSGTVI